MKTKKNLCSTFFCSLVLMLAAAIMLTPISSQAATKTTCSDLQEDGGGCGGEDKGCGGDKGCGEEKES